LAAYKPAHTDAVRPEYIDKSGYWYGMCFWTLVLTYNNQLVSDGDAPKSWVELADPKWKGQVAIGDPARGAAGFLFLKAMVADQGWDWVGRLIKNEPFATPLAPSIEQAIANGERNIGTSVSSFASGTMKGGGPESVASVDALLASPMTASAVSKAPNPEGAELLVDYLLSSDAAALYAKHGWFSTRNDDVPTPYGFKANAGSRVKFAKVPTTMSRQEYLDKYNAIMQAAQN
jgi:iron(III) transport system substrate-binding protein